MAVAWALSMCFIFDKEKTKAFLDQGKLDDFTYFKTLSKMTESKQVDEKNKKLIIV